MADQRERNRSYYLNNREAICSQQKVYRLANLDAKREIDRSYYAENREAILEKQRAYYARTTDERRLSRKDHYQRNRELIKVRHKAWKAANPQRNKELTQKWAEANRQKVRQSKAKWAANNRPVRTARQACRRARQRGAPVNDFTFQQWRECLAAHGHVCFYCRADGVQLQQEHKVPLSRGGSHTAINIVPACGTCNSRKGSKTADEFLAAVRAAA